MNNTISPNSANVSFNARKLRPTKYMREKGINFSEDMEKAFKNNQAIQNFLSEGNPKTLWGKFIDLFKPVEYLEVAQNQMQYVNDNLVFTLRKRFSNKARFGIIDVDEKLYNSLRAKNPKMDKHVLFNKVLSKQVENIGDMDKLLKYNITLNV